MDEKIIELITTNLDSIKEITSFAILTTIAIAISKLEKDEKIEIGDIEIPKNYAGAILFATLCCLIFQLFRLFNSLIYLRTKISGASLNTADFVIRSNPWIFNPFAETDTSLSLLSDNLGFGLLLIIWWLGFHTSSSLLESSSRIWLLTGRLLSLVYLTFGLVTMILISQLISEINTQIVVKHLILILSIPIGKFGIHQIYKRTSSSNA